MGLKKTSIVYFSILVFLFIIQILYLSVTVKDYFYSRLEKDLEIDIEFIKKLIDEKDLAYPPKLDGFAVRLKEITRYRITIIDKDGIVIGDSDQNAVNMANHINREEIKEAIQKGTGKSIRLSDTTHRSYFYYASVLKKGDRVYGFIRIAPDLSEIHDTVESLQMKVLLPAIIFIIFATFLGYRIVSNIIERVDDMGEYSRSIKEGKYNRILNVRKNDEIGELEKNLSLMGTALKEKVEGLTYEKSLNEAVLASIHEAILLLSVNGTVSLINKSASEIFGVTENISGKSILEVIRSEKLVNIINHVKESRSVVTEEITLFLPGETMFILTAMPICTDGDFNAVCLAFLDITRLKKLEQIRKDFVANVSHELKTPITAIKGFAETLLDGALGDKESAEKFIKVIKTHSDRLNSLTEDLITLSRLDAGEITLEKNDIKLKELVDEVILILKEKYQKESVILKNEVPDEIEVFADRNRLFQIMINFVDNGIKFTEKGEVSVKVSYNDETKMINEIIVEDTGVGIPAMHLSRLGERFYRVDSARSRELGGTGLGLSIAKNLINVHGWKMLIKSEYGKGSRFIIQIF